jgi:hypothetical protein
VGLGQADGRHGSRVGLSIALPGGGGNPTLNPFTGQPLVSPGLMAMADAADASHRAAVHAFAGALMALLSLQFSFLFACITRNTVPCC